MRGDFNHSYFDFVVVVVVVLCFYKQIAYAFRRDNRKIYIFTYIQVNYF